MNATAGLILLRAQPEFERQLPRLVRLQPRSPARRTPYRISSGVSCATCSSHAAGLRRHEDDLALARSSTSPEVQSRSIADPASISSR